MRFIRWTKKRSWARSFSTGRLQFLFFLVVPGILEETDCVAVLPLLTARLFESEGRIAVMPLHPQTELGRGRETFWARLIWHERVDRDPAMAWLRGLIKANAERIGDCLDAGADDAEEQ